jgi:hypothetical protein
MAITTASQSQIGQETAKNSQIVTTSVRLINSGGGAAGGPSITSIIVTDSGYNTLDDTAAATSNSYIKILGTGFQSTANVFLDGTMIPTANVTFISSTELRAVLPVSNTGNYTVSVYNSNSAGALYSSSFVISTMPQWLTSATLANVVSNTVFSNTLVATSDSSVTYSNTTILPTGFNLLSNGYYYGNISAGTATTYSFDVKATDAENQDTTRTFSLRVTSYPNQIEYLAVAGGGAGRQGQAPVNTKYGGGGGAGGLLTGTIPISSRPVTFTITIGAGGTAPGGSGVNTTITSSSPSVTNLTLVGGGGGGGVTPQMNGVPGGSGGGAGGFGTSPNPGPFIGGSGLNYPGPTQQGYPGGGAPTPGTSAGAGGGGASQAGSNGTGGPAPSGGQVGGRGGNGLTYPYTVTTYAGGGGGRGSGGNGQGGSGGGGPSPGSDAEANLGGGGGGTVGPSAAGSGGSGVVIFVVPNDWYPGSAPGATVTNPPAAPGKTVLTYTSSGTYTA